MNIIEFRHPTLAREPGLPPSRRLARTSTAPCQASVLALFAGVALLQTGLARGAQLNPGDLVIVKPTDNYNLYRYEPETGAVSTLATGGSDALYDAYDVALGDGPDAGRVWVAVGTIEQVDLATGLVTTTAAGPSCIGITYHNGLLYATALDSSVRVYDPATGALINTYSNPAAAELLGIRYDSLNDRMVLSDFGSSSIEAMTLDGRFSTSVSGQGLSNPYHVALESNGNILVSGALIQRIDVHNGDSVSTVASGPPLSEPLGVAVDSAGQIYTANYGPGSPPAGYGAGDLIRMNADGTAITNLGPVGSSAGVYSLVVVPTGPSPSRTNSSPAVYYGWPRGQTVLVESNATLAVFASGAPPLSYQWMFNGTNLADNGRVIGSRSNLLAIAKVLLSDTGSYQATVTNAYGTNTSTTRFSVVSAPPTITTPIGPEWRFVGFPFNFTVGVGGTVPLTYYWYNGSTLVQSGSSPTYSGTASLANAGNISVVVSNETRSFATSGPVVFNVISVPSGYPSAVAASSPIAYWRLGETNGSNTAHDVAGGNDGTYHNTTLQVPGYSVLDPDTAASFSGVNSYVDDISPTALNFQGHSVFTLEAWVNAPAGQSDEATIVAKGIGDTGTTRSEQFSIDVAGGAYRFFTANGTADNAITEVDASSGPNGSWQHIVGVYDDQNVLGGGSNMYIYINGVLEGTHATKGGPA